MIILLPPLELHRFGNEVLADFVIDVGLVGLAELVATRHAVPLAVLDEMGTGLMETESNILGNALLAKGKDPVVVARTGIHARLASHRHFVDGFVQIRREVHGGEQGRGDDALALDRKRQEDGQAIVGHLLVLDRTANDDIVIAVTPVVGHALHETVDALGEEKEPQIASATHHLPTVGSPFIGVFQQKIRGEASENDLSALYLPRLVALPLNGEIEITRLAALTAGNLAAIHRILPIDIAVLAPRTDLGATVPRIPVGVYLPMLGHVAKLK